LGVVPDYTMRVRRLQARLFRDRRERPPIELTPAHSLPAEAFRSIRTSVVFFQPERPPRSLLVTSSQPREGKTSTAVNLALSFAHLNHRVALVDADMRQPGCHRVLGVEPTAGLSEVLRGTARLVDVTRGYRVDSGRLVPVPGMDGEGGFHLLQAGHPAVDPAG